MSQQAVEAVIGRAMLDESFRDLLFAAPDQAFKGYELGVEEIAALKAIDAETLDAFADTVDARLALVKTRSHLRKTQAGVETQ